MLTYTLKKSSRSRCLRISVHSDGRVVVSAPRRATRKEIDQFLEERSEWIADKLSYFNRLYPDTPKPEDVQKDYSKKKEKARKIITERVEYFNQLYNFKYGRISIRKQRTCWGSCSDKKNLNFNYKLIDISPELMDYVVVHEICHLKFLNHSEKFWSLIEEVIPEYRKLRKKLKNEKPNQNPL